MVNDIETAPDFDRIVRPVSSLTFFQPFMSWNNILVLDHPRTFGVATATKHTA